MLIPQLRIAQKVPLAIIGGALLVSAAVGVVSYLVSSSTMEAMSQERLRAISIERAERVSNFLDGLTEDVVQLANIALVQDNVKSRWLQADGTYKRKRPGKGDDPFRVQLHLYREALRASTRARTGVDVVFEPLEGGR